STSRCRCLPRPDAPQSRIRGGIGQETVAGSPARRGGFEDESAIAVRRLVDDDAHAILATPGTHGECVLSDGRTHLEAASGLEARVGLAHPLQRAWLGPHPPRAAEVDWRDVCQDAAPPTAGPAVPITPSEYVRPVPRGLRRARRNRPLGTAVGRCDSDSLPGPAHNARMPTPELARHDDAVGGEEESPRRVAGTVRLMTEDPFEIDDAGAGISDRIRSMAARGPWIIPPPPRWWGSAWLSSCCAAGADLEPSPRDDVHQRRAVRSGEDVEHQRLEGEAWLRIHGDRLGCLEDARQDLDDAGEIEVLSPRLERRSVCLPDRELRGARCEACSVADE